MRLDKYAGNPVYTDDLTGLYNKRFLGEITQKCNNSAIVCIFDIDDFKSVNDIHGHFAGDMTIREIGAIVRQLFREQYVLPVRFGGDEFILIFIDKSIDHAQYRIDELRRIINENTVHAGTETFSVTCSFGIAEGNIKDFEHIINKADKALYASKDSGKNRLTVYTENIKKRDIIPNFMQRKLSNLINRGKNIIISGGCCTGKHTCINECMRGIEHYHVYDEYDDLTSIKQPFIIANNPAFMESEGKTDIMFRIRKQLRPVEMKTVNMPKTLIKAVLSRNNHISSLLAVNYADLVSSGNTGIVSRLLKSDLFSSSLYDAPYDRGVYSHLSQKTRDSLNAIIPLGLRFNAHDARAAGLSEHVRYLFDMMILEYMGREYRYTYPALFFLLSGSDVSHAKYSHVFRLASLLNGPCNVKNAEMILDYGDTALAEKILLQCGKNDDYYENIAMIRSEYSDFDSAMHIAECIKDSVKKMRMLYYLKLRQGIAADYIKYTDSRSLLLNLNNALIRTDDAKFNEYVSVIGKRVLESKERTAFYFVLSNHERMHSNPQKALRYLKKAQYITLKEHYVADYAKILMNQGIVLDDMNELHRALKYFTRALGIFELTSLADFRESTMLNMAVVYIRMGNYGKALKYLSELLTGKRSANSIYFRSLVLHNLAELYLRLWDIESACTYNMSGIELYKSQKIKIPPHIKGMRVKLCRAMNMPPDIEYDEINDIMSSIECSIIEHKGNDYGALCGHIVNSDMTADEKCDCLCLLALLRRNEAKERNKILEAACNVLSEDRDVLRINHLKTLMEEQ